MTKTQYNIRKTPKSIIKSEKKVTLKHTSLAELQQFDKNVYFHGFFLCRFFWLIIEARARFLFLSAAAAAAAALAASLSNRACLQEQNYIINCE